jgi:6-phosphogluconolactonase
MFGSKFGEWAAGRRKLVDGLVVIALLVSAFLTGAGGAYAESDPAGVVYVQTNAASGNAVQVFKRHEDGGLSAAGSFATGGHGSGAGLGSQGALALSADGRFLFTVDAGSNDIAGFAVRPNGLSLEGRSPSGGALPVSLATHDHLLYVLNAGNPGSIRGFHIGDDGSLSTIDGSTRFLSNNGAGTAPGPAEVQFNPAGNTLVVTEKATNLIDTYRLDRAGRPGSRQTFSSSGKTPYGFAFDREGTLVVSEATTGSASSYAVTGSGALKSISGPVPDGQAAPCWLVIGGSRGYAYTTNAGSGTISSFRIGEEGRLSLVNATAGSTGTGSHPLDMAFSNNGRFLYNLDAATGSIHAFRVNGDGSLASLGSTTGISHVTQGIAAR